MFEAEVENDGNAVCIADCRFHAVPSPLKSERIRIPRHGFFPFYRAIGMQTSGGTKYCLSQRRDPGVLLESLHLQSQNVSVV